MSSSPSQEEPRASAAGSPGSGKRRGPPEGPPTPRQKENTEPRNQRDIIPESSDPRSQPRKSSSPRSRLAPAGSSDSENQRRPTDPQRQRRLDIMEPQNDEFVVADERKSGSRPTKSGQQRSRLASAGRPSPGNRGPPRGRTDQSRRKNDVNDSRTYPDFQRPEMSPRDLYGNRDDNYKAAPYQGDLDCDRSSQLCKPTQSRSRGPAAMKARIMGTPQGSTPNASRMGGCDGSCVWYRKARAGLDRKDEEIVALKRLLEKARNEIQRLRGSTEVRKRSHTEQNSRGRPKETGPKRGNADEEFRHRTEETGQDGGYEEKATGRA